MSHKLLLLTIALTQAAGCGRVQRPVAYRKRSGDARALIQAAADAH